MHIQLKACDISFQIYSNIKNLYAEHLTLNWYGEDKVYQNKLEQEARCAAALSKDQNITAVYLMEQEYATGLRAMPVDPDGKPFEDPACDLHIKASLGMHPEVKRLFYDEPWLCNKKHPIVGEFRQKGKILNYQFIK